MNIVHLVYSGVGGSCNICLSLFKEDLKYKNYSSQIIFTGKFLSKIIKEKVKNNKFYFIKTIKYLQFLSWFSIISKLVKIKPDVIYLHNYQIIPSLIYSYLFKKKLIYIDHSALNYKKFKEKFITYLIKFSKIHIVVLNKENLDYFAKNNINKKKIHLVSNGVDHIFFKKNKKKKSKFFTIGMAGRLNYFKRQDILIKILSNKRISQLNLKLSFAGDGPYFEKLSKLVIKYNVKKKVVFKGFLNDKQLKDWFNGLDLYVHASSGEGMSISLLQAMSMEIPILASNVHGIKNLFKMCPKIGKLFNNNNYDQISNLIYFNYLNRFKIKKKISRKYIINQFTIKQMHKKFIKIAESIN